MKDFSCVVSTSFPLLPRQLSIVKTLCSLSTEEVLKTKITYCTKCKSLSYWPKWIDKRVFSKSIELATTSSKQSKEGFSQRLVYISTRCTKASNGTCGGSSQVIVLKSRKETTWAKQRNIKGCSYHPSFTRRTTSKSKYGPVPVSSLPYLGSVKNISSLKSAYRFLFFWTKSRCSRPKTASLNAWQNAEIRRWISVDGALSNTGGSRAISLRQWLRRRVTRFSKVGRL